MPYLELKDPDLLRTQAYVDGQWVGASSGRTLRVEDPASGESVGAIPDCDEADTRAAIGAAAAAYPAWRARPASFRNS